jgi:hypothetical protein
VKVDTAVLLLGIGGGPPETFHETFQETLTVFCHEQSKPPPLPNPLITQDNPHAAPNGTFSAE